MTTVLFLALIAFIVAAIGLAIQRSYWVALVATGLALVTLADLWPHLGLH